MDAHVRVSSVGPRFLKVARDRFSIGARSWSYLVLPSLGTSRGHSCLIMTHFILIIFAIQFKSGKLSSRFHNDVAARLIYNKVPLAIIPY